MTASVLKAEVYRTVDEDGNVIFTDQKAESEDSTPLKIRPVQTIPAPKIKRKTSVTSPGYTSTHNFYKSLEIISPTEQETFQNPESITVSVETKPSNNAGHRYRLLVNNQEQQNSNIPRFVLNHPDRGTLVLKAEIINAQGAVLISSEPRTIFVHRAIAPPPPISTPQPR